MHMLLLKKTVTTQLKGLRAKMAVNNATDNKHNNNRDSIFHYTNMYKNLKKSGNNQHKIESDHVLITRIYFYGNMIFPFLMTRLS